MDHSAVVSKQHLSVMTGLGVVRVKLPPGVTARDVRSSHNPAGCYLTLVLQTEPYTLANKDGCLIASLEPRAKP